MTSYKEVLKIMIEDLLSSGADNFTLDYIRTLLRENKNLFTKKENTNMIKTINEYFIDRDCGAYMEGST